MGEGRKPIKCVTKLVTTVGNQRNLLGRLWGQRRNPQSELFQPRGNLSSLVEADSRDINTPAQSMASRPEEAFS